VSFRLRFFFCCCALITLTGCITIAGPFVTNIEADADGNLIIEKCLVEHQSTGNHSSVSTGACRSFLLKLSDLKSERQGVAPQAPPEAPETSVQTP
jgi:hypothetical protein